MGLYITHSKGKLCLGLSILQSREQDSSPTRQFTVTVIEDSSPTDLKTVHRHF